MIAPTRCTLEYVVSQEWDVAVIGAGPAGSLTARQLALRGHRVVLIEKKSLPRDKVCGACVNGRAQSVLHTVGLGALLAEPPVKQTPTFRLCTFGRRVTLDLPDMLAVSRAWFDARLAQFAVDAGVTLITEVTAQVLWKSGRDELARNLKGFPGSLDVHHACGTRGKVRASAIVVADGLGHPSLRDCSLFREFIQRGARVGLGVCVKTDSDFFDRQSVCMGVADGGYVGAVRIDGDRLNLAAAIDPHVIKQSGGLAPAVCRLMAASGLACPDEIRSADWKGTPLLTRRSDPVAAPGLFLVGDAAGYVEPFTGEGIAAALGSGLAVVPHIEDSLAGNPVRAAEGWCATHRRTVAARNSWCRRIAWLLRHPRISRLSTRMIAAFPSLAQPILHHLHQQVTPPEMSLQ